MFAEFMYIALLVLILLWTCIEGCLAYETSFGALLGTSCLLNVIIVSCLIKYKMSRNVELTLIIPKVLTSRRHSGVTFFYARCIQLVFIGYASSMQPIF